MNFRQKLTRFCAQSPVSPSQFKDNRINGDKDIVVLRFLVAILDKNTFLEIFTKLLYMKYLLDYTHCIHLKVV